MSTRVRALGPDDWELLREVRLAALKDSPEAFYMTYAESRDRDEASWRAWPMRGVAFIGWLDDGEPAGMVATGPRWDPAANAPGDDGFAALFAMWVAPRARGTGVADALITAAVEWAAAAGFHTIELEVAGGNERAERVYRRHGFVPTEDPSIMDGGSCMRFPLVTSAARATSSAADAR